MKERIFRHGPWFLHLCALCCGCSLAGGGGEPDAGVPAVGGIVPTLMACSAETAPPPRPTGGNKGPCDIYARAGAPCVAAHSTTRALYAAYNGPLYQVMRQSDGKTRQLQHEPDCEDGDEDANDLSGGRHSGMQRV